MKTSGVLDLLPCALPQLIWGQIGFIHMPNNFFLIIVGLNHNFDSYTSKFVTNVCYTILICIHPTNFKFNISKLIFNKIE